MSTLTEALHAAVCGTDHDEFKNPCSWAEEGSGATCHDVPTIGIEGAIMGWLAERVADVDGLARVLMAAWEEAEGKPVNASYVATFADMARAALAHLPEVTETVQWGIAWADEPDKIQAIPTSAGKEYVDRKASREHGDVIYRRTWRTYADQIGDWEVVDA